MNSLFMLNKNIFEKFLHNYMSAKKKQYLCVVKQS